MTSYTGEPKYVEEDNLRYKVFSYENEMLKVQMLTGDGSTLNLIILPKNFIQKITGSDVT
ncbi:hypothetical protein [Bacillus paramycoides]|uniref:hypothetical protein n=1 Tax=Bacillus paramycoides TaxID=2026194 RepID=UPI002243A3E4|nr:hypothetical protein [Bacillus paramycoides]